MPDLLFSIFPSENFIDLSIYQSGRERCTPGYTFGPAARNHFLFHYILEGKGTLMADNEKGVTQTYMLKAGQGFLLFPGQIATYIANPQDPWTYAWVEFDGMHVKENLEQTVLSLSNPVFCSDDQERKENMKKELLWLVEHPRENQFMILGHLYLFFGLLIQLTMRLKKKRSESMSEYYIRESIMYIEQHYSESISVEMIADFLGITRTYFGRIFNKSMGKSPQQFIIEYRMAKGAELLRLTGMTISDISKKVGYENPLHFSRAFKSVYKLSPKYYREKHQS